MTKVLKPRTFLLVKMSICGGEACRLSLMVAIQRWWRGDALTLLSNIVLLLCSALHPGPGPSKSEHNTASDPPAFLMLRDKLSTGDHHARVQVSKGAPRAREWFPLAILRNTLPPATTMIGTPIIHHLLQNLKCQHRCECTSNQGSNFVGHRGFLREDRQWQVNAE